LVKRQQPLIHVATTATTTTTTATTATATATATATEFDPSKPTHTTAPTTTIWGASFATQLQQPAERAKIMETLNQHACSTTARGNMAQKNQTRQLLEQVCAFAVNPEDLNPDELDEWNNDGDVGYTSIPIQLDDFLTMETSDLLALSRHNKMPMDMFACDIWRQANDAQHPCCTPREEEEEEEEEDSHQPHQHNEDAVLSNEFFEYQRDSFLDAMSSMSTREQDDLVFQLHTTANKTFVQLLNGTTDQPVDVPALPLDSYELRQAVEHFSFIESQSIVNLAAVVAALELLTESKASPIKRSKNSDDDLGEENDEDDDEEDDEEDDDTGNNALDSGPPRILPPLPSTDHNTATMSNEMAAFMAPPFDESSTTSTSSNQKEELASIALKIIFDRNSTGFEFNNQWTLKPADVVAHRYQIVSKIGEATFSVVYKCIDLLTQHEKTEGPPSFVCLKMIKNSKEYFDVRCSFMKDRPLCVWPLF